MKRWGLPKLTVLVRSKQEEHVLAACKSGPVNGPSGSQSHCLTVTAGVCTIDCSYSSPS